MHVFNLRILTLYFSACNFYFDTSNECHNSCVWICLATLNLAHFMLLFCSYLLVSALLHIQAIITLLVRHLHYNMHPWLYSTIKVVILPRTWTSFTSFWSVIVWRILAPDILNQNLTVFIHEIMYLHYSVIFFFFFAFARVPFDMFLWTKSHVALKSFRCHSWRVTLGLCPFLLLECGHTAGAAWWQPTRAKSAASWPLWTRRPTPTQ